MKRDPYKHKERFENWISSVEKCKRINGMNECNSKLFLSYIRDLSVGLNVSRSSKKGRRSFIRLNILRIKLAFLFGKIQERGIKDIRNIIIYSLEYCLTFMIRLSSCDTPLYHFA